MKCENCDSKYAGIYFIDGGKFPLCYDCHAILICMNNNFYETVRKDLTSGPSQGIIRQEDKSSRMVWYTVRLVSL